MKKRHIPLRLDESKPKDKAVSDILKSAKKRHRRSYNAIVKESILLSEYFLENFNLKDVKN